MNIYKPLGHKKRIPNYIQVLASYIFKTTIWKNIDLIIYLKFGEGSSQMSCGISPGQLNTTGGLPGPGPPPRPVLQVAQDFDPCNDHRITSSLFLYKGSQNR